MPPDAPVRWWVRPALADLWSKPAPDAGRVSQLLLGAPLQVLGRAGAYCYVEGPDAYRGWLQRRDLIAAPAPVGPAYFLAQPRVPLFPTADSQQACDTLFWGTRVVVDANSGSRCRLALPGGPAWVESAALRPAPSSQHPLDIPALIVDAHRFLGAPYLWGGGSIAGIDCSGFVQALYRLQGRELCRDTHLQIRHGVAVFPADLRAGDVLFFGSSAWGLPTHVGLYQGEGKYVHAHGSGAHCVEVSPLAPVLADGSFWGARRLS